VLRVLANLLGLPGFEFDSSQEVLRHVPGLPAEWRHTCVIRIAEQCESSGAIDLTPASVEPVSGSYLCFGLHSAPRDQFAAYCRWQAASFGERGDGMIDAIFSWGQGLVAAAWWAAIGWPVIWALIKVVLVLALVATVVTFTTLYERKLLGWVQIRLGPNRVGPWGLLQPIADALKLMTKEIVSPARADKALFYLGPVMTVMPAMAVWAMVPFGPDVVLANVNAGLLFIMAIASMEVYGVIISGWSSNSKYAFLGALRASAQMVSYEIAMGFCFVIVLMVSASLNLTDIVTGQGKGQFADMGLNFLSWNWLPLLPIFVVYFVCGLGRNQSHAVRCD
jgi:NADH-quinone oxidoreductase subunit H